MNERDDPARRLHAALSAVQEAANDRTGAATGSVLALALDVESPARAIGLLVGLLEDVRQGLRTLAGTHSVESYLTQIEPLEAWLGALNLARAWKENAAIDARAHEALLLCSDQLQVVRSLRVMADDDLTRLRDEVGSLLDDVLAADNLNDELRRFLIASARSMRDALDDYGVRGSSHVLDVIERAAGAFAIYRPRPETDEGKSLWKRLVTLCGEAIIVMTFIATIPQLPANLRNAYEVLATEVTTEEPKAIEPARPRELNPAAVEADRAE